MTLFRKSKKPELGDENKPLYVIVSGAYVRNPEALQELERIKAQEYWIPVDDVPKRMPRGVSKNRKIKVCGCFLELCVAIQYHYLEKKKYDVEIYHPACQELFDPAFFQKNNKPEK